MSLIRTLQALVRRRGVTRLYDGLSADTISTILSSFLYFLFYSTTAKTLVKYHERNMQEKKDSRSASGSLRAWEEILIGLVAGIASKGITLPLSAVSVRQRLGDESGEDMGMLGTIQAMYSEGGLKEMFAALPPSIPLALMPSLTLYIHSALLRLVVPIRHRAHPPGQVTFLLGALSNALATIPLYPLVLIKALGQSGSRKRSGSEAKVGLVATAKRTMEREGCSGLYKGLEGQLLKGLVSQGVMMLVKQR